MEVWRGDQSLVDEVWAREQDWKGSRYEGLYGSLLMDLSVNFNTGSVNKTLEQPSADCGVWSL